ncbi:MarR family winged helix-turn-helix transcriptional regulator [Psychromicrobium xiongbiense]|uniref:MarR family winged helix-turn-helix transcriptional regulator n=1 Tax=Psychromicrobium xiongbiense TaxID=3051184 RepID=UPI0025544987|nr:MarR family transcriptional regulator [Psychromicrobium sp. YIM S02556]
MSTTSPDDARRDLELALGVELNALLSASRALTERTAAAFHPDLQPAAFHLARWLYAYGPANPSMLSKAVAMDRSSTSHLIGKMKRLDLVISTPDPADRRGIIATLTPAGRARVEDALNVRGTTYFARTDSWSDTELESLTALLHKFNTSVLAD